MQGAPPPIFSSPQKVSRGRAMHRWLPQWMRSGDSTYQMDGLPKPLLFGQCRIQAVDLLGEEGNILVLHGEDQSPPLDGPEVPRGGQGGAPAVGRNAGVVDVIGVPDVRDPRILDTEGLALMSGTDGISAPQFLFPPNIFIGLGIIPMGFEPPESRLSWPPK